MGKNRLIKNTSEDVANRKDGKDRAWRTGGHDSLRGDKPSDGVRKSEIRSVTSEQAAQHPTR